MSMNATPSANRVHIGIFGRRNAGKSSLMNAIAGQQAALVSDVKGTTTDPVQKAMEILPLGPVVLIDTPGLDDEGELGLLRVKKAKQVMRRCDIALLVIDCAEGETDEDRTVAAMLAERKIPTLKIWNKADVRPGFAPEEGMAVSAATGQNIYELKEALAGLLPKGNGRRLVADLLEPGDTVVLVIPIDEAAPKGRLILPQQQTIRDVLEAGCSVVVCRDTELKETLGKLGFKPKMVITDSQAFGRVAKDTPEDILMTSFSILMARFKGDLRQQVEGAAALSRLKDGDKVLVSEGCTHHRQCGDIGSVKIPNWIRQFTGAQPVFEFTSGTEFPEEVDGYKLILHCGGCMLTEKEIGYRLKTAKEHGVPIVNYGVAIAQMHGILRRSLQPFPDMLELLEK